MEKDTFREMYGTEPQEVTPNYVTKALGKNYHVKDSFIEFCDNAFDAKLDNEQLKFNVTLDEENKTITIYDNGAGIKNERNLFLLGGTDKEGKEKIGKYGVGVAGAVSGLATKCRYNKNNSVEVIFESAREGLKFEKPILYTPQGEQIIGKAKPYPCDKSLHYTKITFKNVVLKQVSEVAEAMELTFEEPLKNNLLRINFGTRTLGQTMIPTFIGDEKEEKIKVGKFNVYLKWRINNSDSSNARDFEKTGIRIYDKKTGRLLGMGTEYWYWYSNRKAQQNICGVRVGIYIESSIECYDKFGVKPTKNGINYTLYFRDSDFNELTEKLADIYKKASKTTSSVFDNEAIIIGARSFQPTLKLDLPFVECGNTIMFRKKLTNNEIANLINENLTLKKKLEKKYNKSN